MRKDDVELTLLAGRNVPIEESPPLAIRQLKLSEILEFGWLDYWHLVGLFLFDFDELIEKTEDEDYKVFLESVTKEDYLLLSISQDLEFAEKTVTALNLLSQGVSWQYQLVETNFMVYFDNEGQPTVLDSNLLEQIVSLVEIVHCTKKPDDVGVKQKPSGKLAELLKKKEEANRKLKQAKKRSTDGEASEEGVGFSDLISIVSAKANGISIFSIWDLTYFQLYNQFLRLQKMETFNLEFQSSIAAMKASNNLAHWMGRL